MAYAYTRTLNATAKKTSSFERARIMSKEKGSETRASRFQDFFVKVSRLLFVYTRAYKYYDVHEQKNKPLTLYGSEHNGRTQNTRF